jgi:excisionase family DNA binding protein
MFKTKKRRGDFKMRELMTVREAAAELRVSVRRMQQLIAAKKIPVLEFGPRTRRIPRQALTEFALRAVRENEREAKNCV